MEKDPSAGSWPVRGRKKLPIKYHRHYSLANRHNKKKGAPSRRGMTPETKETTLAKTGKTQVLFSLKKKRGGQFPWQYASKKESKKRICTRDNKPESRGD